MYYKWNILLQNFMIIFITNFHNIYEPIFPDFNPVAIFIASSVYRFLSTCLGVKEVIYRDIEHDTWHCGFLFSKVLWFYFLPFMTCIARWQGNR